MYSWLASARRLALEASGMYWKAWALCDPPLGRRSRAPYPPRPPRETGGSLARSTCRKVYSGRVSPPARGANITELTDPAWCHGASSAGHGAARGMKPRDGSAHAPPKRFLSNWPSSSRSARTVLYSVNEMSHASMPRITSVVMNRSSMVKADPIDSRGARPLRSRWASLPCPGDVYSGPSPIRQPNVSPGRKAELARRSIHSGRS